MILCIPLTWAGPQLEGKGSGTRAERSAPPLPRPVLRADSTVLSEIKACSKQPNKALESTQQGLLPSTKLAAASRGVRKVHSKGEPRPLCCHCVPGSHNLASPCLLSQAPSLHPALKSGQALLSSTRLPYPPRKARALPSPPGGPRPPPNPFIPV